MQGVYIRTKKHLEILSSNLKIANASVRGKVKTKEHKLKLRESQNGENSVHWKGDTAGYVPQHIWIHNNFGKASKCENLDCVSINPKRYEWANISHEYKRDIKDYMQLCTSCHRKYDYGKITINLIKNNEKN